ncbi:MAG: arsenite methyltransferase [Alphaproteobacteria bacterium]|nr:arsenite methyltransferase [Alphaproteobacteria bacterium]
MKEQDRMRSIVRQRYGSLAGQNGDCCDTNVTRQSSHCCTQPESASETTAAAGFFYTDQEVGAAPEGSFMGLGCGNPLALAGLRARETVLDLGSGGGFDCFLAAQQVGPDGMVIGVDMTPEMVARARANAVREGYKNVDFRLGELENLPVADGSVDVIISNCVVNLSPDKPQVFAESFRVLKPGGRLMIMDMVAKASLPDRLRDDPSLYCECVSGAAEVGAVEAMLAEAGFGSIRIRFKDQSREPSSEEVSEDNVHQFVSSAGIEAVKSAPADT